ncbi:MAG: hypothetical protein HY231_26435 [Acidobacteria bacterium]|nr:hypothetical protein [Acidobacteriota bacterium]
MRCPKCYTETDADALNCPSCHLPTPKGKEVSARKGKATKTKKSAIPKFHLQIRAWRPGKASKWALLGVLFVGLGVGVYWYIYSAAMVNPTAALAAMTELRKLPSKEEGKTIDDCMNAELKKSKDAGQLLNYQGWTVKPYNKGTLMISFSFEEKSGKRSADWIVDPQQKTFTPITELANAAHKP